MKKQILNIGKALSRAEQKEVFGGNIASIGSNCTDTCTSDSDCDGGTENTCNKCGEIPGTTGKSCITSSD